MKNTVKISCILLGLLFALLFVGSAFALVNGQTVSEAEKRSLAPRPALSAAEWFSGRYARAAEEHLTDHVLLRETLIRLAQGMEKLFVLKTRMRIVSFSD